VISRQYPASSSLKSDGGGKHGDGTAAMTATRALVDWRAMAVTGLVDGLSG
jgi:hypothetical protein